MSSNIAIFVDGGASSLSHAREAAEQEGTLQALVDAGAQLLPSACGVCAGYGDSLGANETVISSTAPA